MTYRVGLGFDIHRLKKGRPLFLGGVRIPHPLGLEGHSDADVVLHAIIDALLGAAGLPDIGTYFPPGEPKTRNIASSRMLLQALQEVKRQRYRVGNVDVVVIAEAPHLAAYRELMRRQISRWLGISLSQVQIKGKTHEGLDALGQRKAIAAHAVVLIEKVSRSSFRVPRE